MLDFEVQRCTRRCAETDREFQPEETFFSVLKAEGGDVNRYDYCQEAWQGPPEDSVGWWRSQMPAATAKKVNWAPSDVMIHYLEQIEENVDKRATRFVLALLMIRRKILRLEQTTEKDGREVYQLLCPKNEKTYEVIAQQPSAAEANAVQEELGKLLFADAT